ncbi:helix-turn-helix domain-containing protein [Kordia algicida OT-1]|uniref:TPR-repeat-containing protein n=1 Tax=Kordia algicida OT-1 TaxID=391587 RepID=A9E3D1_9FLAO|nr:AraC family transcriptional regulator [Kordia algicida]EDP95495.1 TPR-repeat-containing protein [Kordia algicida OT-1]
MTIFRFRQWSMFITCIFLYCFTITTYAQNSEVTASQKDLKAFEASLQSMSFKDIVEEYYVHRIPDSAKAATVINYLRTNFTTSKDNNEVAEAYITMSSWQNKNNNLQSALASLAIGIEKSKQAGNTPLLYEAYKKKGTYELFGGITEDALESFLEALALAKKMNTLKEQIETKNNISLIKIQVNDNLGAIDFYLENLQQIKASEDKSLESKIVTIYLGLTKAYINLDKHDEASWYINQGLSISKQTNNVAYQAYFKTFLGEIESNRGNYEKAHQLFKEVKELINKAGGSRSLDMFLKLYIGRNYAAQNKHELAIQEFLEGERLLQKNDIDYLSIQGLYTGLAKSYMATENIKESSKYFNKATEIDAKNDKIRAILKSRITKTELDGLKEQIDAIEVKSQQTTYYYALGIGILLIVIIGLIVYYKKQQRKNKARFQNVIRQLEEKRQQEKLRQENVITKEEVKPEKSVVSEKSKRIRKAQPEIDEKTQEILNKLAIFEADELFLSKESTLVEVAKKIQTNTTYLSKVINTYKEKSFTAYITDLRVDYAIERLSVDKKFRSFTIGAIAQEIGFKRSESLSKAFKVKTGLYPSYFIKELEKQEVTGLNQS